tara:strand:- start:2695 stop:3624 length:930 start_codon:yes stop_codon:yes gene_type:complete
MIEVKNLTKTYDSTVAINNLNFQINKGEIVGFLGPNGAGKTTTMKILTCFMPATSGQATINGLSVIEHSHAIRKMIGYLPENNPLYVEMTVHEYLTFIANIRQIPSYLKKNKLNRVIELCDLNSVLHKHIEECSKGFRQRVGLAQALIHEPDILILDEPTVGLDPTQIMEIRHLIKTLGESATIIMCSHILSEISATCSNVFILKKGEIIANGSPKSLTHQDKSEKTIYFETNHDITHVQKAFKSFSTTILSLEKEQSSTDFHRYKLQSASDIRTQIYTSAVENKWLLRELTMEENSLEDVFIGLTKES